MMTSKLLANWNARNEQQIEGPFSISNQHIFAAKLWSVSIQISEIRSSMQVACIRSFVNLMKCIACEATNIGDNYAENGVKNLITSFWEFKHEFG